MGFVLDLIVIAIIILVVYISAKQGFVRVAIELVGFIAAIVASLTVGTYLSNVTYDSLIEPAIVSSVGEVAENATADTATEVWDALPSFVRENAEKNNINRDKIDEVLSEDIGEGAKEIAKSVSEDLIKPFAVDIIKMIYTVILMVLLLIIVKIVAKFINKLFDFSIVGKLNRFLGGSLGLAKGVIVAWLFCVAVALIISFTKNGFWIFNNQNIDKTYIFKILANVIKF